MDYRNAVGLKRVNHHTQYRRRTDYCCRSYFAKLPAGVNHGQWSACCPAIALAALRSVFLSADHPAFQAAYPPQRATPLLFPVSGLAPALPHSRGGE